MTSNKAASGAAQGSGRSHAGGFTLIEILVVMLIIGILATAVSVSIGNRSLDETLLNEALRLQQVLKLASEEAESKGVQLGFRYTDEGYEFLVLGPDGKWAALEDNSPLRPRELGSPFELELKVDGRSVPPGVARDFESEDKPLEPQILLLSSGELSPFLLHLGVERTADTGQILQGVLTGDISLHPWSRELWNERSPAAR